MNKIIGLQLLNIQNIERTVAIDLRRDGRLHHQSSSAESTLPKSYWDCLGVF